LNITGISFFASAMLAFFIVGAGHLLYGGGKDNDWVSVQGQ
jgi:hypothetical protein